MYFHSVGFLFVFLPVFLLCLKIVPLGVPRGICVLFFSYLFYSGSEPQFVWLLLISSVVDYVVALQVHASSNKHIRKLWLLCSLIVNLGILGVYKYGALFLETVSPFFDFLGFAPPSTNFYESFVLPAGISFYTFQSMAYTIDVYRGEVKPTKSFLGFCNYVAYLPQLIAGPIERYSHLAPQIENFIYGKSNPRVSLAVDRIALGIIQKLLIADSASYIVDVLGNSPGPHSFFVSWAIALGFGIQIFYDFSAYTHMAIGIALLMGVELAENFLSPYKAKNVQEFWRCWHLTLSRWFRDYVYIPLGGSKVSRARVYFNLFITFTISGLWHGAGWNFVLWGAAHGIFLIIVLLRREFFPKLNIGNVSSVLMTFIAVHLAWVLFRFEDLNTVTSIWSGMAGLSGFELGKLSLGDLGFLAVVVLGTQIFPHSAKRWPGSSGVIESVLLWVLALFAVLNAPQVQQFIYFRF